MMTSFFLRYGPILSHYTILLPLIFFCFIPVRRHLIRPRIEVFGRCLLTLIVLMAIVSLFCLIFHTDGEHAVLFFLIPVFYYFYYRETTLSAWPAFFILMTACMLCAYSALFAKIFGVLAGYSGDLETPSYARNLFQFGFLVLCDVVLYFPVKNALGWVVDNLHRSRTWQMISLLPIIFTAVTFFILTRRFEQMLNHATVPIFFAVLALMIFLTLFAYILLYVIARETKRYEDLQATSNAIAIQARAYDSLYHHVMVTRQIRHDFRHHLNVMSELAQSGDYDALKTYLDHYSASVTRPQITYAPSPAVNAIITHFVRECETMGFTCHLDLRIPNDLPVDDMDLCIVLGNLFENAYLSLKESDLPTVEKTINCRITCPDSHHLVIIMKNPFTHLIVSDHAGNLRSTRREGSGIGLRSVRAIAEKYDGTMQVTHDSNIFTVRLLFNI